MDFVSDTLESGRKFRVLNILDDFDRSAVAQEISMSMPSERVIRILEKIIWIKGKPENIRCDNGPEFISNKFQDWCKANDITIKYTQPGCPTQNSFVKRFNGSYRRAILDAYIFRNLNDVRELIESWMTDYNVDVSMKLKMELWLSNLTLSEKGEADKETSLLSK